MRAAFNSWGGAATARQQSMRLLRRSAAVLFGSKAAKALRVWRDTTLHGKQLATVRRALSALHRRELGRAYRTWAAKAEGMQRAYALLGQAASSLMNARSARALNSWCALVEQRAHEVLPRRLLQRPLEALEGTAQHALHRRKIEGPRGDIVSECARANVRILRRGMARRVLVPWRLSQG